MNNWLAENWKEMETLGRKMAWNRRHQTSSTGYVHILTAHDVEDVVQQAATYWYRCGEARIGAVTRARAQENGRPIDVEYSIYWTRCVKTAIVRWRRATGMMVIAMPEPEERFQEMESPGEVRELLRVIQELPISERARMVLLATAAGYNTVEISQQLEVSRQAVSLHLQLGRSALRAALTTTT